MSSVRISFLAAILLALAIPTGAADPVAGGRQVVASAHPVASAAGKEMLDAGGNAVDAAVAVQMALSVVEPHASGVGGGGVMLLWDPERGDLRTFDGLASQPARATVNLVTDVDGSKIPEKRVSKSGRSVGVPGVVAMLATVHAAEGRLPWARLFEPAIRAAEAGFPMPPYLHHALIISGDHVRDAGLRAEWFDSEGKPRPVGTLVRNPDHAASLRRIAAEGADALRRGELARAIVAAVAADQIPGLMTGTDLEAYQPRERPPVCADVFAHRICSMPPPTYGGIVSLQILALTAQNGIADLPADSVAAAHIFLEASRIAFADRSLHIADPDFEMVPTAGLVAPAYMRERGALIRKDATIEQVVPGNPTGRRADIAPSMPMHETTTSHFSIVDADGRIVAMTTTINLYFGSGIAVSGFFLNNALTNFAENPVRAGRPTMNRMIPGKRPYTSMSPTIAFDAAGSPVLAIGAAGGARIPSYVAQTMLGILAWGQDIRTAMAQPHWHNGWWGASEVESETPAAAQAGALAALGHKVKVVAMKSGLAGIARTPAGWVGASDPRRDGGVVAD